MGEGWREQKRPPKEGKEDISITPGGQGATSEKGQLDRKRKKEKAGRSTAAGGRGKKDRGEDGSKYVNSEKRRSKPPKGWRWTQKLQ